MSARATWLVRALAGWTLLVWTTRIANVVRDDTLTSGAKAGRVALALSFTVLAVAALVAVPRARRSYEPQPGRAVRLAVGALCAWTVGVWLVRTAGILARDHEVAFKVVHTVLAVVSIALAGAALRAVRSRRSWRRGAATATRGV